MLKSPTAPAAAGLAFSAAASKRLPPTNAIPPSSAPTRAMASRRLIRFPGSISGDDFTGASQVATIQFIHCVVHCPRSDRHVGERGILTGAGHHARAVGDEHIRRIPRLIVRVEHGGLR